MNTFLDTKSHKIEVGGVIVPITKEDAERAWRDSELVRTDELVKLPDYPVDLLLYRAELRDYPAQPDFPDGTRPTI